MPTYLSPGVYVEESDSGSRPIEGVGTAIAAFVGMATEGPVNDPTLVTNWTQFIGTFGEFAEGSYLAHAVYGYFQNGGGSCYVVRVGANGASSGEATARVALQSGAKPGLESYRVVALEEGAAGNDVSVEVRELTSKAPSGDGGESKDAGESGGDGAADSSFTLIVKKGGRPVETFENVTTVEGHRKNVVTVVNQQSKLIRLEAVAEASAGELVPKAGTVSLSGGSTPSTDSLSPDDYVGDSADRTGFGGLEAIPEITMVSVPDLMAAYQRNLIDLDGVKAVQLGMIAHCELMANRVAIIDPPPGLNAQQIKEWRVDRAGYDSKYAALYWPWVRAFDPATGDFTHVPPSGHVAGIWGRNDATRGVHKAPANEIVRGALDVESSLTKAEHDLLNPVGINCIRTFPGRGIRVWGARTLSSDPAWRYLNVRRLFNYLEDSILNGTQWVVFEPNDHALWAKVRRTITSFLTNEWRRGSFFGLTPDQAFYVKCDEETNPQEQVDAGMVLCEVGVAPSKPAEFVVFRLSQFSGGGAAEE